MLISLLWFKDRATVAPCQLLREFAVLLDDADSDSISEADCMEAFDAFFEKFMKTADAAKEQKAEETTGAVNPHRTRQASYDLLKALVHAIEVAGFNLWQFVLGS